MKPARSKLWINTWLDVWSQYVVAETSEPKLADPSLQLSRHECPQISIALLLHRQRRALHKHAACSSLHISRGRLQRGLAAMSRRSVRICSQGDCSTRLCLSLPAVALRIAGVWRPSLLQQFQGPQCASRHICDVEHPVEPPTSTSRAIAQLTGYPGHPSDAC